MLAYRHAFHAGNHGDVLKHTVLIAVLQHFLQKDVPFTFVDTHAGAGGYALDGRYARTTGESDRGVMALTSAASAPPPLVQQYLRLIEAFNGGTAMTQYPGSPALASMLLRADDPMRLWELHPTEERILRSFLGKRMHTDVHLADGFEGFVRALPPPSRRGLVLIDPSYEMKSDYVRTLAALRLALTRFATGTFIVWYPQLQTIESTSLPKRLTTAAGVAPKGWVHATLNVARTSADGFGMVGSGVLVVNPPFTLAASLRETLPWLAAAMGDEGRGTSAVHEGRPRATA